MTATAKQFSRALRNARGKLTQAQAAACIPHLPVSTYKNWEQGHRTPPKYWREVALSIIGGASQPVPDNIGTYSYTASGGKIPTTKNPKCRNSS